jgi:hypothetical protein
MANKAGSFIHYGNTYLSKPLFSTLSSDRPIRITYPTGMKEFDTSYVDENGQLNCSLHINDYLAGHPTHLYPATELELLFH